MQRSSWDVPASRRAGLRTRSACSAAAPRSGRRGSAYGRSEPWQMTSMPEHAADGVDGALAVARGLDEGERVDGAGAAAARPVALAMQRGEAGERDEADPQARPARAPAGGPRPPGGMELRHVRDDAAPTSGAGPRRPRRRPGPGWTRSAPPRASSASSSGARRSSPSGAAIASAATSRPTAPAVERGGERCRRRAAGRRSPTRGTAPAGRARPRARRRRARPTRSGRRSSPSAADGATSTRSSPSAAASVAPRRASWWRGSISQGRSPGSCSVQPSSRGAPAAVAERREERRRPEVLVDVGGHAGSVGKPGDGAHRLAT